jgi:hypothetical protein
MPLTRPSLWIDQRAKVIEAIGSYKPGGHKLPQPSLDLRFQLAGCAYDVGKE